MSGLPPTLTTETGTPSNEWAQKMTNTAFDRADHLPAETAARPVPGERADSTPGVEFPGAFPKHDAPRTFEAGVASGTGISHADSPESGTDFGAVAGNAAGRAVQTVSDAAQSVSNTAAQYLPIVVGAVSSYIPGSGNGTVSASEHDIQHKTSFPSSERSGASPHEHIGGVGALPGSISEQSVTKLPDERNLPDTTVPGVQGLKQSVPPESQHPLAAASYPAAPYASYALGQAPAHSGATAVTARTSKPSYEVLGAQPKEHSDGAGALPGRASEASVAKLPDERQSNTRAAGGVGALPGGPTESGVAVLPDERNAQSAGGQQGVTGMAERAKETAKKTVGAGQHDDQKVQADVLHPNLSPRQHALGSAAARWGSTSVGDSYKEGRDVDIEESGDSDIASPTDPARTHDEPQEHEDVQAGAGARRESHSEKTKKVGFMAKMKGEAKVLLGKIEGKNGHDKVEEGKKMKAGEA